MQRKCVDAYPAQTVGIRHGANRYCGRVRSHKKIEFVNYYPTMRCFAQRYSRFLLYQQIIQIMRSMGQKVIWLVPSHKSASCGLKSFVFICAITHPQDSAGELKT